MDLLELLYTLRQTLDGWLSELRHGSPSSIEYYTPDLTVVYQRLKAGMGSSPDVLMRWLDVPACAPERVLMANIDGLSNAQMVDQDIVAPLLQTMARNTVDPSPYYS